MPSLREILARHAPLLLLDAASAKVQVGWLRPGDPARWSSAEEEAGTGLFRCLETLGVDQAEAAAFAFSEGPGSLLGIRTTAMVLRTWLTLADRPVYAFQSLALVARARAERDVCVIADARRDAWHCTRVDASGAMEPLRRVPTAHLTGRLLMPDPFRHWSALPPGSLTRVPYDLSSLLPQAAGADLFRATDAPDAFLHEEPAYVTWTPQVHRAPAAS